MIRRAMRGRIPRVTAPRRLGPALLAAALLACCHGNGDRHDRIGVSVIGPPLGADGPRRRRSTAPEIGLRAATGAGLLRLDQAGQLIPGLAIRWAIVDDGLDGIFRLDGPPKPGARIAVARLRATLAALNGRVDRQGIDAIAAVTDRVVDIRLAEPRSELLTILAAPELATLDPAGGPMRVAARIGDAVALEPRAVPGEPGPAPVLLRGESVGRAVARFVAGKAGLVLGGTFADLPVAHAAALPRGALRFDRASGLFGLVPADRDSDYAAPALIQALSLAIDRDRIAALVGAPGAAKATTLGGSRYEAPLADRRQRAIALVASPGRERPPLRVALPPGPGATSLFRLLAQDWAHLGIAARAVGPQAAADIALVDIVVPAGEIARTACAVSAGCDPADKAALLAPLYIPIGTPFRWSLVAPNLDLFTENALAVHPLDRLRSMR